MVGADNNSKCMYQNGWSENNDIFTKNVWTMSKCQDYTFQHVRMACHHLWLNMFSQSGISKYLLLK